MELKVGCNSYMTMDEVNEYINSNYVSATPERKAWEALSDDDKAVVIIKSTRLVDRDSMLYVGRKVDKFQKMQFPRDVPSLSGVNTLNCPDEIKEGIILIALRELVYSDTEEMNMINKGIKSFSDGGGLSMSFNTSDSIIGNKVNGISIDIFNGYFAGYSLVS